MEKKIKILYILSIIAILAFLGMQAYWLYSRYEFSIREYEDKTGVTIEKALDEYSRLRSAMLVSPYNMTTVQSAYNLNTDIDSTGRQTRKVTVTSHKFNARHMLGIQEDRDLTLDEKVRLAEMVADSMNIITTKESALDVSAAPSDAAAWTAMKNFEFEFQHPFTVEGIDSLLRKENIDADITLAVTDTMMWRPQSMRHVSVFVPRFKYISPYSELECKAVVIDCKIPASAVVKEMGGTLIVACVLSLFLIACLVWQILTIVKLTRLDKMRSMFVTTMIHELKRPISTLKMCVSGIENDRMMADATAKAELMSSTRTALDNLSAYFSKLRDITFNNVEQIPLNITRFNLWQLVDDVLSSIPVPPFKDVRFENGVDRSLEVSADRTHVFNILNNLVENAIKYSGPQVVVAVSAVAEEGRVAICVADDGNGIEASEHRHIFTRFYRGRASSSDVPGMGLGLAYVELLAGAHGGSVQVESTPGEGSEFTVNLPQ